MAAELKQEFIEAVRLMPDGIQDFLTTPLPTAPTISTPGDVDAAIVASGVLSKYLLDLFVAFDGFTPIEMLARIGQHNNVLEAAMIAGLEYLEGEADSEGGGGAEDFTILEPEEGGSYLPGSLRLIAKATNQSILQMAVEAGSAAPVSMASEDGQSFYGFVRLEEVGSYTATFTALFEDESTQTASVSFAMATEAAPGGSEPANPDGSDLNALTAAKKILDAAIAAASKSAESAGDVGNAVVNAGRDLLRIGKSVLDKIDAAIPNPYQILKNACDALESWLGTRSLSRTLQLDDLFMAKLAAMNAAGAAFNAAVIALYWQNNQHPAGGYTSCPEVLTGAAQAMNDKYGPGTVTL
jgi:hypothetical protein